MLASAVLPMAEVTVRRGKEIELRRALRTIRTAIDDYHDDFERAKTEKKIIPEIDETGYPKELEDLLKGKRLGRPLSVPGRNTCGAFPGTPSMPTIRAGDCAPMPMSPTPPSGAGRTSTMSTPRATPPPWTAPLTIHGKSMNKKTALRAGRGFTLIELLIVMTIIGILASIAVPSYQRSTIKAREAVLMEDLYQMRRAIDAYFADHASYPDSLETLVETRYLRGIPRDPFTGTADTWKTLSPEPASEGEVQEGNVFDVASGSNLVGLNGIPYSEW